MSKTQLLDLIISLIKYEESELATKYIDLYIRYDHEDYYSTYEKAFTINEMYKPQKHKDEIIKLEEKFRYELFLLSKKSGHIKKNL